MKVEDYHHLAEEIGSIADIETIDSYEDNLNYYKNKNFSYIPLPSAGKYCDVDEGWLSDLSTDQFIHPHTHLKDVLVKMQNSPFLLIDRYYGVYFLVDNNDEFVSDLGTGLPDGYDKQSKEKYLEKAKEIYGIKNPELLKIDEFRQKHPSIANDVIVSEDRYMIITIADLNRRPMKEMLYRLFAEIASSLSNKIEKQHDSESVLLNVSAEAVGRWKQDQMQGIDLHISEKMNLMDMMHVLESSNKHFVKSCGFESKNNLKKLSRLSDIRNRVMHANRSLVYNRDDIQTVLDSIDEAESLLSNMD